MDNIFHTKISNSTLDDVTSERENRTRRSLRTAAILVVCIIVSLALFKTFERQGETSGHRDGITAQIDYPLVVRAGNEVTLDATISSDQPLPATLTLFVDRKYLEFFEDFALFPDPQSQSSDGQGTVQFDISTQPDSHSITVRLTGRASDQWQLATPGTVGLTVGETSLVVPIKTWRIP